MDIVFLPLLIVTATIINQIGGAPAERCKLGEDIINSLFNTTTKNEDIYSVEGAVGIIGNIEELLPELDQKKGNFSLADLEACLQLYKVQPPRPPAKPSSSADSNLAYNRPGYLGAVETIPVPEPPSTNFVYGHGYTTYQRPFFIVKKVKEYTPNPYLKANSIQDLILEMYTNFLSEWNSIFDGKLRPKYWNIKPNRI